MPDDFKITAERMRDSSRKLHDNRCFHNSCYLSGYVVECYLKLLKGIAIGPGGNTHNISALNNDLQFYVTSASTSVATMRPYILDTAIECPTIFSNWHPTKRYDDGTAAWDEPKSQLFQSESEKCFDNIVRMTIDSII